MPNTVTDFLLKAYGEEVVKALYLCMFPTPNKIYQNKADQNYINQFNIFHDTQAALESEIIVAGDIPTKILEKIGLYLGRRFESNAVTTHAYEIIEAAFPWEHANKLIRRSKLYNNIPHFHSIYRKLSRHQAEIMELKTDFSNIIKVFGFDASYLPNWHPYKKGLLLQSKPFMDKEAVFGQL